MSDKKGLTIVFSVTVVLLIVCGGMIATAGFTDVKIPILSKLLNKDTSSEEMSASPDAISEIAVLPAEYDPGTEDRSVSSQIDDQTEWGSRGTYDPSEDADGSYFGYDSRLEYIVNSYIVGKRLLSYNMFEHIPPEWFPSIGYQIPEGAVTLAELRAMSIDERVDFYTYLVSNAEFPGEDYNWAKVDYSCTVPIMI